MGQAKDRGTREQRIAQSIERSAHENKTRLERLRKQQQEAEAARLSKMNDEQRAMELLSAPSTATRHYQASPLTRQTLMQIAGALLVGGHRD